MMNICSADIELNASRNEVRGNRALIFVNNWKYEFYYQYIRSHYCVLVHLGWCCVVYAPNRHTHTHTLARKMLPTTIGIALVPYTSTCDSHSKNKRNSTDVKCAVLAVFSAWHSYAASHIIYLAILQSYQLHHTLSLYAITFRLRPEYVLR